MAIEEVKEIWRTVIQTGQISKEEAIQQIQRYYNLSLEEKRQLIHFIQELNTRQTNLSV